MLRIVRDDEGLNDSDLDPIPFPGIGATASPSPDEIDEETTESFDFETSPDDILDAIDSMSRHIDDLAREFNYPGQFEDDPDDGPPRAA